MLLAVDSGNTNVVFAIFDGETIVGEWRASSNARRTADEYAVWLTQLMALKEIRPKDVTGVVIGTVVPASLHSLKTLATQYFHVEPVVVGAPGVNPGIKIDIEQPRQAGADRLANAACAYHDYGGDVIVVDFGTATNFDIVSAEGALLGAVFAPGVNLSVEALTNAAAQLPRVAIEKPERVVGRATVPAMQSGLYWGYVGLIEGLVARIKEELGRPMQVIATGGLAPIFHDACPSIDRVDPTITLRGLKLIYGFNARAAAAS